MPPGSFGDRQMNIGAGDLFTLSVSFADSSPTGGAFPETCRFPAGGITAGPTGGLSGQFLHYINMTVTFSGKEWLSHCRPVATVW